MRNKYFPLRRTDVDVTGRRNRRAVYDEILDVLETRREYLEGTRIGFREQASVKLMDARLDELTVVRVIINTLRGGEDE